MTKHCLFLVAAVLAGCYEPTVDEPDLSSRPVATTVEEFLHREAEALCQEAVDCGGYPRSDVQSCNDVVFGISDNAIDGITKLVAEGRIDYDSSAAQLCLDLLSLHDCGDPDLDYARSVACARPLVPKISVGRPCVSSLECANGWCNKPATCGGTCVARVPDGAACDGATQICLSHSACNTATHICEPFLQQGAPCANGGQCAPELTCRRQAADAPPFCQPRGGLGDSCGWSCQPGLVCVDGTCAASAEGHPCNAPFGCGTGVCMNKHCHAYVGYGEACIVEQSVSPQQDNCATGKCVNGTCATGVELGGSCDPKRQNCDPVMYCDPATKTCVRWRAMGEPCTPTPSPMPLDACGYPRSGARCDDSSHDCVLDAPCP